MYDIEAAEFCIDYGIVVDLNGFLRHLDKSVGDTDTLGLNSHILVGGIICSS